MMNFRGIHHVTLLVDDYARTAWFYGNVLGFPEIPRPNFTFSGLFYRCGSQEIHIIVRNRPMTESDLFLLLSDGSELTRRYIHRHAAFAIDNLDLLENRLREHKVEILIGPNNPPPKDFLGKASNEGWERMYDRLPLFVHDPSGNLIEFVPATAFQGEA